MRKVWTIAAAALLGASTAWAGGSFGLYGAWWDTDDLDAGYGGGAKLKIAVAGTVALEVRASYIPEFDAEDASFEDFAVVPVEAGLVVDVPLGEALTLYVGGGGGYYVTPEFESKVADADSLEPDIDLDDVFGYYGVGGVEINLSPAIALFAEAQYRVVEVDEADIDDETVEVDLKLTGVAANAGLLFKW